jgi:hypothetical protein
MVIVGVGLNSQVGNIMSLLGATEGGNKEKAKKKDKKSKTSTPSATKVTANLSKQSVEIEDETKASLPTTTNEYSPLCQSAFIRETNVDGKDEPIKNGQGGMAKLAADVEQDEVENVASDGKHRCKYQKKNFQKRKRIVFSLAVLQEKITRLALYIGYIGRNYFLYSEIN